MCYYSFMKEKLFKRTDILIIAAVLLIALALVLFLPKTDGMRAVVMYGDEVVNTIDLTRDAIYNIDADLPVTLEVKDGKIHFINSKCPDLTCEHFGLISNENEYAICAPARVSVFIEEG